METTVVLDNISRIVEDEWARNGRPILLSSLPKMLESEFGVEYRRALGDKGLKAFLQENAEAAGVRLVQDPAHHARVGIVPMNENYVFHPSVESPTQVSAADARAFARVLDAMTADEQQALALPASFVVRLLTAK